MSLMTFMFVINKTLPCYKFRLVSYCIFSCIFIMHFTQVYPFKSIINIRQSRRCIFLKFLLAFEIFLAIKIPLISTIETSSSNKRIEHKVLETIYQAKPKAFALSSVYLIKLAEMEKILYSKISEYKKTLIERLRLAEVYIEAFEQGTDSQTPIQISENPISSYKMIRRLAKTFENLAHHIEADPEGKLLRQFELIDQQVPIPSDEDHEEALKSLLNIQYVYDLKPSDLIHGVIKTKKTTAKLTPIESYEIAEFATNNFYFYLAANWMQALQKFKTELPASNVENLSNLWEKLTIQHDSDFDEYLTHKFPYIFASKINGNFNSLPSTLREKLLNESIETLEDIKGIAGGSTYHYIALCNGVHLMTPKDASKLNCWLDTKRNPYFTISPLKMELLHENPLLLQIYDIINNKWIDEITKASIPLFDRAPKPEARGDTHRTAIYAWLGDEDLPNVPLPRLHELIFDLNTRGFNASEFLQVASYALGGQVSLHVDYMGGIPIGTKPARDEIPIEVKLKGDRVSTFLAYLNDVELGGYTAFPQLKTFVKPAKGSAVFWYTSLRNGDVDARMVHGACPILHGGKWICTKWVHQFENFLKRKCATDPNL